MHKQDSINTALQNQLNQLLNCCKNNEGHSSSSHRNNSEQHYKTMGVDDIIKHTDEELNDAQSIVLEQNRPNPFSGKTEIDYYLPENTSNAQLKIYDNLGRELKEISLLQGYNTIEVNIGNLTGGSYTYCIVINGSVVDRKTMLYIK